MALTKISRGLLSTGVSDSSDATAITIDSSEKVGLNGLSAGDYWSSSNQLVFGNTASAANGGMTIATATNAVGQIYFADGTSGDARYRGQIQYTHVSDAMDFATAASFAMRIDSAGRLMIGTTTEGQADADDLTVANASGNVGISLRTTTTGFASIYFSDATSGGAEASGAVQYKHDDNYMRFTTAESERMRIDSSGNVMVATTAQVNSSLLSLSGTGGGVGITYSGAPTYYFRQLYQSSSGNFFFYNGNNQSYIDQSGSFNDASDERIKKDIEDIDYGLDIVKALKPRKYKMKLDDTEQVGFIAQEVESLVPEVVDTGETPDGEEQKGMSYGHLTAVLTKAIQELSAKVEELESKINE